MSVESPSSARAASTAGTTEVERLGGLRERYDLSASQVASLGALLRGLAADPHAPTTVRESDLAIEVHLADSLTALELDVLQDRKSRLTIADLGAGAGFPGLAVAVALEESEVRLVESQGRKCRFMRRLADIAGIANARVVCARAEDWRAGVGGHDLVLARAVGPAAVVLEYAAPLLKTGGSLIEWRGGRDDECEREASAVAGLLGLRRSEIRRVVPFAASREHHLHVYEKVGDTPGRFPRRAGVARRRPLTASDGDRR